MSDISKVIKIEVFGLQDMGDALQAASKLDVEITKLGNATALLKQKQQELIKNGGTTEALEKNSAEIAKNTARMNDLRKSYTNAVREVGAVKGSIAGLAAETARMTEVARKWVVGIHGTEKELERLKRQISSNKDEIRKFEVSVGNSQANVGRYSQGIKEALGAAGSSLGLTLGIGAATAAVMNLAAESVNLALKAEGIEKAFNKLNRPDLLDKLRAATKGAVDDVTLMQNAVKADNFNIPLDALSNMFAFAEQRAKDTGESVDYLVESAVLGISRQSVMIIDNLGISSVAVREEMEKTGDFATAVSNIMAKELQNQGNAVDEASVKVARYSAQWKNFKVGFGEMLIDMGTSLAEGLEKFDTGLKSFFNLLSGGDGYGNGGKLFANQKKEVQKQGEEIATVTKKTTTAVKTTLTSLKQELSMYNEMLEKEELGSPRFKQIQADIEKTQNKINAATGKANAAVKKATKDSETLKKEQLIATRALAKQEVDAITNEEQRKIALLKLSAQFEIEDFKGTAQQKAAFKLAVEKQLANDIEAIEKKVQDVKLKNQEKETNDLIKDFQKKMKLKTEQSLLETQELDRQRQAKQITEKEYLDKILLVEKKSIQDQVDAINNLLYPQTAELGDSGIVQALQIPEEKKQEILAQLKQLTGEMQAIDTEYATSTKKLQQDRLNANLQVTGQLIDSLAAVNDATMQNATLAKGLAYGSAVINTFAAANMALASSPPPLNFIAAGAVVLQGLANVAQISKTDFKKKARGGLVEGASHDNGGVKYFSPSGNVELEGGELVVNKNIWSKPEYVSAISEMNYQTGGIKFARGGQIPAFSPPAMSGRTQSFSGGIDYSQLAQAIAAANTPMFERINDTKIIYDKDSMARDVNNVNRTKAINKRNATL